MIAAVGVLQLAAGAAATPSLADPVPSCAHATGEEIVVCGSRDGRSPYRLPKLANQYPRKAIHPEKVIPGGRIHADPSSARTASSTRGS